MDINLEHINKPNFYIVGAPKCGTTAFNEYLNQHPEINMLPKEIHFWSNDLKYREYNDLTRSYSKALSNTDSSKLIGEGAVWYLTSKNAAENIKKFTPDAKILIFLRNPVEACYSLYQQTRYNGDEPLETFEEAINKQEERTHIFPEFYNCPTITFQYKHIFLYNQQVFKYIDLFGSENVKIIIFEEFIENKLDIYNDVLSFLKIKENPIDLKPINKSKVIKSESLRNLTLTPNPKLKTLVKTMLPFKSFREKIKAKLWKINSKETERKSMSPITRKELELFYKSDIKDLEILLGKELTHWK